MTSERPLRILHCPDNLAGHAGAAAAAERALGLDSRAVVIRPNRFHTGAQVLSQKAGFFREEAARARLLAKAVRWADIVHFNYGTSIARRWQGPGAIGRGSGLGRSLRPAADFYVRATRLRDLNLLRRIGKPIVVTYQGDDARQMDVLAHRGDILSTESGGGFDTKVERAKREAIAIFDRYADVIIASTPDLLEFLPERAVFVPAAVSMERLTGLGRRPVRKKGQAVVVAHAPSDRVVKGTRFLVSAIDQLQREGLSIELSLIEGRPADDAARTLGASDVVVDQLLIGWYGVQAVEGLALGKPVIAHIRDEFLRRTPSDFRSSFPIIPADVTTIAERLREICRDPPDGGATPGLSWAEKYHGAVSVARRHADLYGLAMESAQVRRQRA